VANGGKAVRPPTTLQDPSGGSAVVSEVALYGDVVLRYISGDWKVRLCCSWHREQCCLGLHGDASLMAAGAPQGRGCSAQPPLPGIG
jgi:hypothetical protein